MESRNSKQSIEFMCCYFVQWYIPIELHGVNNVPIIKHFETSKKLVAAAFKAKLPTVCNENHKIASTKRNNSSLLGFEATLLYGVLQDAFFGARRSDPFTRERSIRTKSALIASCGIFLQQCSAAGAKRMCIEHIHILCNCAGSAITAAHASGSA
jgi:hypothetical protein